MKTETEQLKENRDRQYAQERAEGLKEHLTMLHDRADAEQVLVDRSRKLELCVMATWFVTLFFGGDGIQEFTWILWIVTIGRNIVVLQSSLMTTVQQLAGIYKALELLGMIDKDDSGRKKRLKKYKKSLIAEKWARLKAKRRQEVFA